MKCIFINKHYILVSHVIYTPIYSLSQCSFSDFIASSILFRYYMSYIIPIYLYKIHIHNLPLNFSIKILPLISKSTLSSTHCTRFLCSLQLPFTPVNCFFIATVSEEERGQVNMRQGPSQRFGFWGQHRSHINFNQSTVCGTCANYEINKQRANEVLQSSLAQGRYPAAAAAASALFMNN